MLFGTRLAGLALLITTKKVPGTVIDKFRIARSSHPYEPRDERAFLADLAPAAILIRLHLGGVVAVRIIRIATDRRAHTVADR